MQDAPTIQNKLADGAIILCLTAMILALIYVSKQSGQIGYMLLGFLGIAASTEIILQKAHKRKVKPRI